MFSEGSRLRRAAAWGVHFYTALGLPLAALAAFALHKGDAVLFFIALAVAVLVDATDGAMARLVRVRAVLPFFDGRRLDDIVDFITFAFLPALALPAFDLLPEGFGWLAVFPLLASGYGFCQEKAKTDDAFVGFPSYWNIVVLYLYATGTHVWFNAALIAVLSLAVFIPIHYVYPTKTKLLRPVTLGLGGIWGMAMFAVAARPDAEWAALVAWLSLAFPAYYVVLSAVHHTRVHRARRRG